MMKFFVVVFFASRLGSYGIKLSRYNTVSRDMVTIVGPRSQVLVNLFCRISKAQEKTCDLKQCSLRLAGSIFRPVSHFYT